MLNIQCDGKNLLAQKCVQNGKFLQVGKIQINIFPCLKIFVVVFGKGFYLEEIVVI